MSEFGILTLFRERSVIHRSSEPATSNVNAAPLLTLRSNRVTIPLKTKNTNRSASVRGQNTPSCLRMAAVVLDEIQRDGNVAVDGGAVDWHSLWVRKISQYEIENNTANWVSVHIAGRQVYASAELHPVMRGIEMLAVGTEVTAAIVKQIVQGALGTDQDFVIDLDSQTALTVTPGAASHRASILERRDRKTGALSVTVTHPNPKSQIRLGYLVNYCADLLETLNLKATLDRAKQMTANGTIGQSDMTPTYLQATSARRRDLIAGIETFEKANKVAYRPDRPKLY